MSPDTLREKMDKARKQKDPNVTEKLLDEFLSPGHSELTPDIQETRSHLQLSGYDRTGG